MGACAAADPLGEGRGASAKARGIRVNAASPGTIDTPGLNELLASSATGEERQRMIAGAVPLARFGRATEVAQAVVFLRFGREQLRHRYGIVRRPGTRPSVGAGNVGLFPPDVAAGMSGLLRGLLDGSLPAPPFSEVMDVWPCEVARGRVVFEAVPSARFYNPMSLVHAGQGYTTVDLHTPFVKAVRQTAGRVKCEGRVLPVGERVASAEGRITSADGTLLAHGSET